LTANGHIDLSRAYYHCASCNQGECPADDPLGLEGRYSPAVCELVSLTCILEPFGKAEDLLQRLSGLKVTHESARTLTETLGEQLEAQHQASKPVAMVSPQKLWDWSLPESEGVAFSGTVAYLGLDAFSVPILDAQGKREWKMMYVGLLCNPKKEHTIYLTGYDQHVVAQQMRSYAIAFRLGHAKRVIALTDGANGLEATLTGDFGGNVECILDFWHASQHLHAWAKLRYGAGSEDAKAWAATAIGRMRTEGGEALLKWLPGQMLDADDSELLREEGRKLQGYIEKNVHRMNYPQYRSEGLDIGSGPTEAGCKIVGQRLKGCGMKWHQPKSAHLAALRALYLSGEGLWDTFFDRTKALAA
jgi:hypothetical protein